MKRPSEITEIMENSIHLINESYNQQLHLNTLARQNYMSPATYSRYFFQLTQCSFTDYINRLRVEHAQKDLITTGRPLTDIAMEHGFSNSSVFSKIFRQYTKLSPSDFRKKYKSSDRKEKPTPAETSMEVSQKTAIPYKKPWLDAINAGEACILIRSDFQKQLLDVTKKLSISYVRLWDIFSKEIFPCGFGEPTRLDFNHLDSIFDFLVNHNLKPWINLTKSSDVPLKDIENITSTPPEEDIALSPEDSSIFYENLLKHWIIRYGSDTVSQWRFECWYNDRSLDPDYRDNYLLTFILIRKLIKNLIPKARLGAVGNALPSMAAEIDTLLGHWPSDAEPDFISMFCFPYQKGENEAPVKLRQTQFTKMALDIMNGILRKHHMEHIPVYITQWNITVSPRNAINDSCIAACSLLSNMEETLDHTDPIVYCHVSDIGVSQLDTLPLTFGGNGLMTRNSFYKPSFYALLFYKKMPSWLIAHGPGYIITTDQAGRFDLLLFNACPLPDLYYHLKEYEITNRIVLQDLSMGSTYTFRLGIHTSHTAYRQQITRLTPGQNDLLGHLQKFGESVEITLDELEYLWHTARPAMNVLHLTASGQQLEISEELKAYEICYISLCPVE
ncbi:AraC-like DNA-binding protein/beta-xylosidase [Catenibacillus scindens]|uniref:AraC-like DNA-binding protein/beta-xylosidase n=1 Tax=Catenibacillus scindens TaxID=673271 RepID=A0A7W8M4I1_9FIRM|nr:helix-turn-helix domain-containing protein [Catenibacillus scindens]MBB5263351.1 AraC-like DNA-binding protein/beta-xylosidase [Catenibacillus scindens]